MSKLAIHGGEPVRTRPFPPYVTIGEEEKRAVAAVLDSTVLSKFLGTWDPDFFGGPRVQELERAWSEYFGVTHSVSVNSATSGLYAAVGAAGVGPGDEVIVSPYTMTASATAAVVYGAVPIFADIDPHTFCLTPESIREHITPYTKAIIVVDLFGHPADMDEIMSIAEEHRLVVIEDAAQAPGARYKGRYAGTLAHMGVFSLNYHKTIHCGEGGVIVTDSDTFAERLKLIRNHAEAVVEAKGVTDIVNLVGFNYRMTEIEAAIAREQLTKLESLVSTRIAAADYLTEKLSPIVGLTPPVVKDHARHGYYVYAIRYDERKIGTRRDAFVAAVTAEGIPMVPGYTQPLYMQPMYQKQTAFGRDGFPFTYHGYRGKPNYFPGSCPVTEKMYSSELMFTDICHSRVTKEDLDDAVAAVEKVMDHRGEIA